MYSLSIQGQTIASAWYAQYPNHNAGDAKDANAALGELDLESASTELAKLIKAVKVDQATLNLQHEFYKLMQSPLETKAR